ncbi:ABC transporter ATP-binding protein [Rhodocyclus tenuis]|uniref:ATP-binding cassette domain-containing protein n=2 Tax=Rhodocyclus TaxID=1064 RepID=A0A6L5JXP9_RHOTE|nr:ABC transporter ATP-binding protein [Rhodocyclus gracilis]MQY51414.1 ATP-binding cassette domain-containing protein [Rhodocyclus gracilis]NJA89262.1 ABC transporter ATP-binding protein [Rhodocyclus gracilis]
MSAQPPLLETRALAVRIAGKTVCTDLDFTVAAGERLAILGRNGAGKTTLLTTLAGLRPAAAGQILVGGHGYGELGPRGAARQRGWLAQHREDAFGATALEIALTGRHPHLGRWQWESADDADIARAALAAVGLKGFEARDVLTLSGGERQRLAMATLLAQAPQLYLLDEPIAHLDLNHQIALLELFARAAAEGAGVVMSLHDPGLALRYADRALLLYGDGRAELGPADEILTAERLSALYQHPLVAIDVDGRRCFIPC